MKHIKKGPIEAAELLNRAANSSSEGITISSMTEPDQPLVYVNDGFVRMTGYSSDEAVGRNCRFLQGPSTDPSTVNMIRNAIDNGEPCTVELLNYRKDGSKFWNRLSITPIKDTLGKITHNVGSQSDITELRETRARLELANTDLERFHLRITGELEQARRAQEFLLPAHLPLSAKIQFASKFVPMTEVGGDFYDILELSAGVFGILIADVTGHGIPAALMIFMSSTAFKNTAPRHLSTSDAIFQTNERLVGKMPNDAFVTMFYLIYDSNSGTLRFTQAGHPDGFVLRPNTDEVIRISTGGTLVGVFSGSMVAFPEEKIQLQKGDKVILYTDAISETLISANQSANVDPLEEYLLKHIELPLAQLFDGLYQFGLKAIAADKYADDFTLVGFEVIEGQGQIST